MDVGSQRKYKQSLDTLVEERQSGRRHGVDEMRQAEQRRVALAVRRHCAHFLPPLPCVCDEPEPTTARGQAIQENSEHEDSMARHRQMHAGKRCSLCGRAPSRLEA